jgi:hypothetical protein
VKFRFLDFLQAEVLHHGSSAVRYEFLALTLQGFVPQNLADFLVLAEVWWQLVAHGS